MALLFDESAGRDPNPLVTTTPMSCHVTKISLEIWKLRNLTQDMARMVPRPLAHMVPQLSIRDNWVIFKFLKVVIFYFFLLPRNGCFGPKLTFKSWIRWRECDAMHGKWKSQSIKKFMIIGFVFLRITRAAQWEAWPLDFVVQIFRSGSKVKTVNCWIK